MDNSKVIEENVKLRKIISELEEKVNLKEQELELAAKLGQALVLKESQQEKLVSKYQDQMETTQKKLDHLTKELEEARKVSGESDLVEALQDKNAKLQYELKRCQMQLEIAAKSASSLKNGSNKRIVDDGILKEKNAEIDRLKALLASKGEGEMIEKLKEQHATEIEELKAFNEKQFQEYVAASEMETKQLVAHMEAQLETLSVQIEQKFKGKDGLLTPKQSFHVQGTSSGNKVNVLALGKILSDKSDSDRTILENSMAEELRNQLVESKRNEEVYLARLMELETKYNDLANQCTSVCTFDICTECSRTEASGSFARRSGSYRSGRRLAECSFASKFSTETLELDLDIGFDEENGNSPSYMSGRLDETKIMEEEGEECDDDEEEGVIEDEERRFPREDEDEEEEERSPSFDTLEPPLPVRVNNNSNSINNNNNKGSPSTNVKDFHRRPHSLDITSTTTMTHTVVTSCDEVVVAPYSPRTIKTSTSSLPHIVDNDDAWSCSNGPCSSSGGWFDGKWRVILKGELLVRLSATTSKWSKRYCLFVGDCFYVFRSQNDAFKYSNYLEEQEKAKMEQERKSSRSRRSSLVSHHSSEPQDNNGKSTKKLSFRPLKQIQLDQSELRVIRRPTVQDMSNNDAKTSMLAWLRKRGSNTSGLDPESPTANSKKLKMAQFKLQIVEHEEICDPLPRARAQQTSVSSYSSVQSRISSGSDDTNNSNQSSTSSTNTPTRKRDQLFLAFPTEGDRMNWADTITRFTRAKPLEAGSIWVKTCGPKVKENWTKRFAVVRPGKLELQEYNTDVIRETVSLAAVKIEPAYSAHIFISHKQHHKQLITLRAYDGIERNWWIGAIKSCCPKKNGNRKIINKISTGNELAALDQSNQIPSSPSQAA